MQIERLTSDQTLGLPKNITTSYQQAKQLASDAERNFNESWYFAAMAEVANASTLAQETIKELGILVPILKTNRTALEGMGIVIAALVIVNVYLYYALSKRPSRQPAGQRPRRRRESRRQ